MTFSDWTVSFIQDLESVISYVDRSWSAMRSKDSKKKSGDSIVRLSLCQSNSRNFWMAFEFEFKLTVFQLQRFLRSKVGTYHVKYTVLLFFSSWSNEIFWQHSLEAYLKANKYYFHICLLFWTNNIVTTAEGVVVLPFLLLFWAQRVPFFAPFSRFLVHFCVKNCISSLSTLLRLLHLPRRNLNIGKFISINRK